MLINDKDESLGVYLRYLVYNCLLLYKTEEGGHKKFQTKEVKRLMCYTITGATQARTNKNICC